jgi:hypothetical protein
MAGSGRSSADEVLVSLLAGGTTRQAAAARAGVAERTVYRRLEDPGFRGRIEEARADMLARTSAMLTAAGTTAAETLVRLLEAELDTVKLAAAVRIIELGTRLRESEQIEARLAALEAQLAPRPEDGRPRGQAARW